MTPMVHRRESAGEGEAVIRSDRQSRMLAKVRGKIKALPPDHPSSESAMFTGAKAGDASPEGDLRSSKSAPSQAHSAGEGEAPRALPVEGRQRAALLPCAANPEGLRSPTTRAPSKRLARIAVILIGAYQRWLSPLKPAVCRFRPTCSEYAKESIRRKGLLKGGFKAFQRLLKCHPFHSGGDDPVL